MVLLYLPQDIHFYFKRYMNKEWTIAAHMYIIMHCENLSCLYGIDKSISTLTTTNRPSHGIASRGSWGPLDTHLFL